MESGDKVVAGVDVGGASKGFHAVALSGRRLAGKLHTTSATEVNDWCVSAGAVAVGVDAPCRPSLAGKGRTSERAMAAERIFSFSTPTRERANTHPFYGWMLRGWELFGLLQSTYPLFEGATIDGPICFETFPHAVACALAGEVVSAKRKNVVRRALLRGSGVDEAALSNIDEVDAALCALAASHLMAGQFKAYGSHTDGLIVVPLRAAPF